VVREIDSEWNIEVEKLVLMEYSVMTQRSYGFHAKASPCSRCSSCLSLRLRRITRNNCFFDGNKSAPAVFYYVDVSGAELQPDSFEELAMPLFDQLYNFAHWLTQNREEAEDLVQETYAKALKGFSSFQLGTNFRAWMYRILRNTFLTSRTGLKATMTVPLDLEEDGSELAVERDTPETLLFDRTNRELLQHTIDELPVYFREILLLCEVEEMSYQEMAETLSIPVGTVMSRLSRARKTLRDRLRPQVQVGAGTAATAQGTNHGL
jgi:RNA polymerase sigma-70 factor (ECF subfamily)